MQYATLGRTGLRVSRMGLGCGGHSRLGLARGGSAENAERIVKDALALGVNLFDTAEVYGTEQTVGRALEGVRRDTYVLSTKLGLSANGRRFDPADYAARIDATLKRLRTDYVDILHLHGVSADEYDYARDEVRPALDDLVQQGKVRHVGITEAFVRDPSHVMLSRAVRQDAGLWDVVMVGFNLLNPSARKTVLPRAADHGVGTLGMFAVRRALSRPEALREVVDRLVSSGEIAAHGPDAADPLVFLTTGGVASSVLEAGYRFCLHEPGLDVILSGTGDPKHLQLNAAFLNGPPLPRAVLDRLRELFGKVDSISGN